MPHGRWDLSSPTRDGTSVPWIRRQILNHLDQQGSPLQLNQVDPLQVNQGPFFASPRAQLPIIPLPVVTTDNQSLALQSRLPNTFDPQRRGRKKTFDVQNIWDQPLERWQCTVVVRRVRFRIDAGFDSWLLYLFSDVISRLVLNFAEPSQLHL